MLEHNKPNNAQEHNKCPHGGSERPNPKTRQGIKLGPGRTRVLVPAPERNHVLGTSAAAVEAKPRKR